MTPTKSTNEPTHAALREVLKRVIQDQFAGSQTQAAKSMGVSQGLVSSVVNENKNVGLKLLIPLAKHAPEVVAAILGLGPYFAALTRPSSPAVESATVRVLPNLLRAREVAASSYHPATLTYCDALAVAHSRDRTFGEWMQLIEAFSAENGLQGWTGAADEEARTEPLRSRTRKKV